MSRGVAVQLSRLDGLATEGFVILEHRASVRVHEDFELDPELPAVTEHRRMICRNTRRSGVEVEAIVEFTDLPGMATFLDRVSPAQRPAATAHALARFQQMAVVSRLTEQVGGGQAGEAGAQNDDAGPTTGSGFELGRACMNEVVRQQAETLHDEIGSAEAACFADQVHELSAGQRLESRRLHDSSSPIHAFGNSVDPIRHRCRCASQSRRTTPPF